MKKFIKSSNILIFFTVLMLLVLSEKYRYISTSLLSTLPASTNKTILKKFETTSNNMLFIALKGFENKQLKEIISLEKSISKIDTIEIVAQGNNKAFSAHQKKYALLVHPIDEKKLQSLDIKKELSLLYHSLTHSFIPTVIDTNDPLHLLQKEKQPQIKLKNGHTILEDYGYISYFKVSSKTLEEHSEVYNKIKNITQKYTNIKVFSPLFYYVENANAIKKDANNIIVIALFVLLSLYLVLLKNSTLFINTIATLATSSVSAFLILTQFYNEISIFVIVFGVSISAIAIDYMFHHYMHQHYMRRKSFNKEVFYGFLTTAIAFLILGFISFPLIKQICLFSLFSLSISYLHFAFLYPKMHFKEQKFLKISLPSFTIKANRIFLFSVITLIISTLYIHFDFNIKSLDYDNQTLKKEEAFFKNSIQKQIPILINAPSIDELIKNAKKVKALSPNSYIPFSKLVDSDTFAAIPQEKFKKLNERINLYEKELGFRDDYFKESYNISKLKKPNYSIEDFEQWGLEIFQHNNHYYTFFTIKSDDYNSISKLSFVQSLSLKNLFEKSLQEIFTEFIYLGSIVILFILSILLFITKKRILHALNFLIFPFALIAIYAYFISFNILHILMTLIILAISIDYAFYTSKDSSDTTKQAVMYSLLSTFAGFGVLSFSSIHALHSLGTVASIGIVAIFLLLIFSKRFSHET